MAICTVIIATMDPFHQTWNPLKIPSTRTGPLKLRKEARNLRLRFIHLDLQHRTYLKRRCLSTWRPRAVPQSTLWWCSAQWSGLCSIVVPPSLRLDLELCAITHQHYYPNGLYNWNHCRNCPSKVPNSSIDSAAMPQSLVVWSDRSFYLPDLPTRHAWDFATS